MAATEASATGASSFLPPVGSGEELEMPPPPDGEAAETPMSSMQVKRFLTSSNESFRGLSPER